jgi:nicotinamidase-related amidase
MTLTALDPKTALIVIDLQKGVLSRPVVHPVKGILQNARRLADAFRAKGLPVVLVNVDARPAGRTEQSRTVNFDFPPGWTELATELNQQPSDHTVTKQTPGAFTNTGLEKYLRDRGVTQVVIVGISTSIGVESTARQAYEYGFHVTLPVDAMTDMDSEAHANSLAKIFPRIGETGTTQDVLDLLNGAH